MMHIIEIILEWIPAVIGLVILAGGAATLIVRSRRSAREWLLFAVTEAEKALGSGTGELKLRVTYDAFIKRFPLLSKFVTFDTFSSWVDISLSEMRKMLEKSSRTEGYVKGDE